MSEETTPKSKAKKLTFNQFLGIISIYGINKFAAEKMYAGNTDEKTPKGWDAELSKVKDLNYIYKA
jgi:hypothetical protein